MYDGNPNATDDNDLDVCNDEADLNEDLEEESDEW